MVQQADISQPPPVERIKVAIHPEYLKQSVMLGGDLTNERKRAICEVLKANLDLFNQKLADMTGVPRTLVEHKLVVKEGTLPVRQKKRGQAPEISKAITEEVQNLVEAGIMREVTYHNWISNPVLVKKHDESWQMWLPPNLNGRGRRGKTAFHTSQGVLCYIKMSFWLKNASTTYQRLVDKAFNRQIGRNLEVYVDDLVIKSHSEAKVVRDIKEMFRTLRKINMKLNPKKCTFRAAEGTFMGNNIGREGIQACNEKTQAVINMSSPRTLKQVQSLNVKLTSFNRFLSKAAEKSLPFFKTLKRCIKKSDFVWTEEAERALKDMKKTCDRKMLIYFVGRALQSPEVNYTPMEKLILALVHAAKRLRRYFQAHPIAVVEEDTTSKEVVEVWKLFIDGSSNEGGSRAGLILTNPDGVEFTYALRFEFKASNNEAEYEALLAGLRIADNKQPLQAKEEAMQLYLSKAKDLAAHFRSFSITQVPRSQNKQADALSKMASVSFAHLTKEVLVEILPCKSIKGIEVMAIVEEEGDTWMTP
ncbi:reverse transcriptase domain-containing protein, partial [Tanacetum coccineum]